MSNARMWALGPVVMGLLSCGGAVGELEIVRVDANQGVAIPLYLDGAVSTAEQRPVVLLQGRETWVMVHVAPGSDWEATELEAVLVLEHADGQQVEATELRSIHRSTEDWTADPSGGYRHDVGIDDFEGFAIGLPAEVVQPGLYWHLEVRADGRTVARVPDGELADMGVSETRRAMHLELQAIEIDNELCTHSPDASPEGMADFLDHLMAMGPIDELVITEAPPLVWQRDEVDRNLLLDVMAADRAERGVAPHVYTQGVVEVCGEMELPMPPGGAAMAPLRIPDDTFSEWAVSVVARNDFEYYGDFPYEIYVFTHELFHLMGRGHAPCRDAAAIDADYPHDDGSIGTWGLDLRNGRMHHPELSRDLMAYCESWWISDYTWRELRSWMAAQDAAQAEAGRTVQRPGRLLMGSVGEGAAEFRVVEAAHVPAARPDADAQIVILDGGGERLVLPATVSWNPEGDLRRVSATLPDSLETGRAWMAWLNHGDETIPLEVLR